MQLISVYRYRAAPCSNLYSITNVAHSTEEPVLSRYSFSDVSSVAIKARVALSQCWI